MDESIIISGFERSPREFPDRHCRNIAITGAVAAVLPVSAWLFLQGNLAFEYMGIAASLYLGMMFFLLRQTRAMATQSYTLRMQNTELAAARLESDRRMAQYFEHSPGLFFTLRRDCDGVMSMPFARGSSALLQGLSPEVVAENVKPLTALCHPADIDSLQAELYASAHEMRPCRAEFRIGDAALEPRVMELSAQPQHSENEPGVMEWHGFMQDITKRKQDAQVLDERGTFLESLLDAIPIPVFYKNRDGRYLGLNRAYEQFFGAKREQLIGKSVFDTHPMELAKTYHAKDAEVFERRVERQQYEYQIKHSDGTLRDVLFSKAAFADAQGRVKGLIGAVMDITERKQMEEQLRMKEYALDHSSDAVFLIDEEARFIYVNEQVCQSLGYSRDELLTMSTPDIAPDYSLEKAKGANAAAIASGIITFETCHQRRDGSIFPVEIQLSVLEYGGRTLTMAMVRDITERRRADQVLEVTRNQLQGVLKTIPDLVWLKDVAGVYLFCNPAAESLFGVSESEIVGKTDYDFLETEQADACRQTDRAAFEAASLCINEEWVTYSDNGRRGLLETHKVPVCGADGKITGVLGVARDITERKRLESELAQREHEFRTLVEHSVDTVARYGKDRRRLYANPAFASLVEGGVAALLGKTPSEAPGGLGAEVYEAKLGEVLANGKAAEFELKWVSKDEKEICSLINLTPEFDKDGEVESVLSVGRDISELHVFRQKIHQMAFFDPLTSLPNRVLFNDRLRQMIADASWHGQLAGVMMIDMDRFKAVNDTMGHAVGDELLRETGARLTACVRNYDTVARLGGDEFAILLPEVRNADDLGRIADKMRAMFDVPFLLQGKEVFVTCSIGISLYPGDSTAADDLVKYADSAMYFAKRSGRNAFRFYSRDLTESANERLTLESELRRAVGRGELELYYQPKVRLSDGEMTGSEALLRWNHPQRGMIPPDKFIPIAEDSGLIIELGEWVLREACHLAGTLNGAGLPLHKIAVNLSARQFQSNDLVATVNKALQETACYPEWLELEITESLLLDEDGKVLEVLNAFRSLGIAIAIDDFGTGYSALSYLARFPINTLKIDRSFVHSTDTDNLRAELVKAILSIAHCLGQQVVAEGVEMAGQAEFLRAHGCQVAQGNLFSKPVSKEEFLRIKKDKKFNVTF